MTDYLTYLDFDLAIETLGTAVEAELVEAEAAAPAYRARVLTSPAGQATVDFTLPFNSHELENYILKMGRPRRSVRGTSTSEGEAAREFGTRLYNAIFRDDVRDALRRSLDAADAKPDHGLRILLRLRDAPELLDLPWEYLYDPTLHRFFCHSVATPLVRYPQQPRAMTPLTVAPPLQVLVMIANPVDVPALDVEVEWGKIQDALAGLEQRGLVELTRLENATLTTLQRQLRQARYHIFHFVGHGGMDRRSSERVLYLEDGNGRAHPVGGDYLGTLLRDHRSLRLALLNACEGARVGVGDPFAGVAQHLVLQGIPAIIAMQFEITDDAAIALAHEFYAALADGYPIEAALAEARKAIFVMGNDVEWGTPVLYARASSGLLFEVASVASTGSATVATDTTLPGRGDSEFPISDDAPAPSRKMIDTLEREEDALGVQATEEIAARRLRTGDPFGAHSATSTVTRSNADAQPLSAPVWRRPSMLAIFLVGVLLLGGIRLWPQLNAMFGSRTNGASTDPIATAAVMPTEAVAANPPAMPSPSITPTPSATPNDEATAAAIVAMTATSVADETTVAIQAATDEAATQTALPTATFTPTAQPTHTPTITFTPTVPPTPTPADGDQFELEAVAMTFAYVSAGPFTMGSPEGEGADDERPKFEMEVDAFWIGLTEVTNAQYEHFIDAGGYTNRDWWTDAGWAWRSDDTRPEYWDDEQWDGPNQPVVGVSWYEATAYATWLAAETGLDVRLPTEAEWEKAARGTDARTYPWGNDGPTEQLLNYNGNVGRTVDVGSYPDGASPYGALDMAGNVWEWTATQWVSNYDNYIDVVYNGKEGSEPRALRGGSWLNLSGYVRSANRFGYVALNRDLVIGFRLVLSAPGG